MTDHDRAARFYARLVALYPRAHREIWPAINSMIGAFFGVESIRKDQTALR